jgi:hypothetical protein
MAMRNAISTVNVIFVENCLDAAAKYSDLPD